MHLVQNINRNAQLQNHKDTVSYTRSSKLHANSV